MFCSCEKIFFKRENKHIIVGEWVWIKNHGGFSGNTEETPLTTGIEKQLIFETGNSLKIKENNIVTETTTFSLTKRESYMAQGISNILIINSPNYNEDFYIQTLTDTLIIYPDGVADGFLDVSGVPDGVPSVLEGVAYAVLRLLEGVAGGVPCVSWCACVDSCCASCACWCA